MRKYLKFPEKKYRELMKETAQNGEFFINIFGIPQTHYTFKSKKGNLNVTENYMRTLDDKFISKKMVKEKDSEYHLPTGIIPYFERILSILPEKNVNISPRKITKGKRKNSKLTLFETIMSFVLNKDFYIDSTKIEFYHNKEIFVRNSSNEGTTISVSPVKKRKRKSKKK